MIGIFDVHYAKSGASAAAVLVASYADSKPAAAYSQFLPGESSIYLPGEFYLRELPYILALIQRMPLLLSEMIVDGYVMLGQKPGLGRHLFDEFNGKIPVIGIAKSRYEGASGIKVYRGRSTRPLYITSAGMAPEEAARKISLMHGSYRIPSMLKLADRLARKNLPGL
jgi:deoxyribonuclease V